VEAKNSDELLAAAVAEAGRLRCENERLRKLLRVRESCPQVIFGSQMETKPPVGVSLSADEKIRLFRSLFRGREDVYAVRWEGRNGKSGYSPACAKTAFYASRSEWKANREFLPLTDTVIRHHLSGELTAGVYPLLKDERCWFLAADFDKATWRDDALAFQQICTQAGIPAYLERSRSGHGAHVWIFFEKATTASDARKLGAAMLTRTMEGRHQIGLDSYDRFFPNQDTLPQGGFGNLIALPLQRTPRNGGNSVFVDHDLRPFADQWSFLSSIRRTSLECVNEVVCDAERSGNLIGIRLSVCEGEAEESDPWLMAPSRKKSQEPVEGPLPAVVRVTLGNLVYVDKEGLPSAMLNRLTRLAAFQNPEFYRAQTMRLSTFGKPRVIYCGEEFARHLGLPRGCQGEVVELLQSHGIQVELVDERFAGNLLEVDFHGELRPDQERAVSALLRHETGVLSAGTAFGKTVIAISMIAARKINTLILVHRRQLLDQWRERLSIFLNLPLKNIGQIGGDRRRSTHAVDVALLQSLNRKGVIDDSVAQYGQVIVDECHHLSAFSFEQVLRQVRARYVLGLTATPFRKDGHHPIILMQCGEIRHRVSGREQAIARPFRHLVLPRPTTFRLPFHAERTPIHEIYKALASDEARNELIARDVLSAVGRGRSPLVLTERIDHLNLLAARVENSVKNLIVLRGGMGAKQRRAVMNHLARIPANEECVLLATGRYIGEGFDNARLDTLFLAMPISWKGTLQQYVGRLHRLHADKREVIVYDYTDDGLPMLAAMFRRRLRGYEAAGYSLVGEELSLT
jgi:superfamily II DNA or RNA helicase